MPKRIVYTRERNLVSVCAPSHTALWYMIYGGRWNGFPELDKFLLRQIEVQAKECGHRAAKKFVYAMQFGGCTLEESYEIMRDRFCAHLGTGCEIWDTSEIAKLDRKYRNAWRRSHNGGPIYLDEEEVQKIDERISWDRYEKLKGIK